jgi:peptidyl-prolyl cis-trans isomerase SDCCAG10
MTDISAPEPPTFGRVLIHTTKGDLDVELWSRECPETCRNFVQLCMEGYYNGNIFHRIIPNFLIQTGDPTSTGTGGESIYGTSFNDEFHARLKFRHRGMLGMASMGDLNANQSQFFITLNTQDSLNGRSTLFGKVFGSTIYTINEIADVEIDKHDRPVGNNPPRIISCEVLENPFPEIVPRTTFPAWAPPTSAPVATTKQKIQSSRGSKLSFQDEEEDDVVVHRKAAPSRRPADILRESPEPVRMVLPEPERPPLSPSPPAPSGVSDVMAEIERLKAAISAASAPKVDDSVTKVKRQKISEDQLMGKLSSWSTSLNTKDPEWCSGPLKFAVDSKTAFQRDNS